MHRFSRILMALIALLAGAVIAPSAALPSQPLNWQLYAGVYQPGPEPVAIRDFAFVPNVILIPAGTTVRWTNSGAVDHTVTSDTTGLFDSGTLGAGASFEYQFNTPGTYTYHCTFHSGMTGTVIVGPSGAEIVRTYLPVISKAAP